MEAAQPKRYQVLSGSSLKLIAIVTMFIDHIGAAVLEMPAVWDFVGTRADVVDPFFNDPTLSPSSASCWWRASSTPGT